MKKIFSKEKIKKVFYSALLLTLVTFSLSSTYLYHFIIDTPDKKSPFYLKVKSLPEETVIIFILTQITILIFLLFLCSLIGFGYSRKYGFKGLGDLDTLKSDLRFIVPASIIIVPLLFFGFDNLLIREIPTLYPDNPFWGLTKAFMTSTTYELVSKFGLVTVIMGVFKNKHIAVFIPAVFFAVLVRGTFMDYGIDFGFNYLSLSAVSTTLLYGLASGYIYIYRGLLTVMCFKFLIDLKYMIYPLIN